MLMQLMKTCSQSLNLKVPPEKERGRKGWGREKKERERKKKGKLILMNAFGEDTLMQSPVPLIITAKGGLHILFSDGYLGFH